MFRPDSGLRVASAHGIARSGEWPAARKMHLKGSPYCKACNVSPSLMQKVLHAVGVKAVQVHHIMPFHFVRLLGRPELELDQRNLITLCESGDNHHLLLGHLDDFKAFNPDLLKFVAKYFGMAGVDIRRDSDYLKAISMRPKDWAQMTDDDKQTMKNLLAKMYPAVAA